MGFWPFGGGKRQRMVDSEEQGRETLLRRATSGATAQQEKYEEPPRLGRTDNKKAREDSRTRRLSKTRNHGSKTALYGPPARSQTTPVRSTDETQRASRTNSQYNEKSLYTQPPLSQTSLGPENFTVTQGPPTLRAKRPDSDHSIPRRKSSKRKAEDFAREREIRAMTSSPIPIPKRPATLYGTGPLQRDSRRIPGPLNRRLERPTSEISLPLPGSLPDVMDFPSQNSFKVGILAALGPRPTVRYDANLKNVNGKQPVRPNMAIRQAIAEEDYSDKKRIDELADDLDAGGLRELMERDRRRRERKKDADKAKLQRKLQRRAERQREEDARRARTEAFVRSSPAEAPGLSGLGVESPTGVGEPFQKGSTAIGDDDPFIDSGSPKVPSNGLIRNPFEDEKDLDIMDQPHGSDDDEAGVTPVRSSGRRGDKEVAAPKEKPSQSTLSPPISPVNRPVDRSSLSQASFVNREVTRDAPEGSSLERRTSERSSLQLSSWTTFFKRGNRRKFAGPAQGRTTPSEFSNTSRESVSRKQPPNVAPRTFRRSDSATPQRTMSRFREDLPELPISPPDSQVQSPEATTALAGSVPNPTVDIVAASSPTRNSSIQEGSIRKIAGQLDPSLEKLSVDLGTPLPDTAGRILSQSLASVDSEAEWLSGRPSRRVSEQLSRSLRPSQSSLRKPTPGTPGKDGEEGSTEQGVEDQLSSTFRDRQPLRQQQPNQLSAITTGLSSRQEEKRPEGSVEAPAAEPSAQVSEERWHQSVGKRPTMVEQTGRTKSDEGLLNEIPTAENSNSSSGEGGDDQNSDTNEQEAKSTPILRATSVEYKGHIRHISAGSAKLLDIKRSSIDIKRSSMHSDNSRAITTARTSKSDVASPRGSAPNLGES